MVEIVGTLWEETRLLYVVFRFGGLSGKNFVIVDNNEGCKILTLLCPVFS